MYEKKVTSIRINPKIWKEIKKYTIDRGMSVSKFVEEFLTIFLSPQLEKGEPSLSARRSDFFWEKDLIDFNTGLLGSNPTRVIGKVIEYLYDVGKYAPSSQKMCERLNKEEDNCRQNLASALGAEADEILFETNTTKSLRLAFNIIKILTKLSTKDTLLTTDLEHNSTNRLLRMESGMNVNKVPLLPLFSKGCEKDEIIELFSSAMNSRTRILFISHIPYLGGKLPVDEIVKVVKECNNDVLCVIDGAHALGQVCINVKRVGCDFYGVGAHKFCLGIPSLGSLYVNMKYLNELSSNGERFPIFDSYAVSKKFRTDEELGTINAIPIIAFNEAYDLLFRYYGIDKVQQRIASLARYFIECTLKNEKTLTMVSPSSPDLVSGVISIAIRNIHSYDEYEGLVEWLENKHRIICKALKKPPCIRVCLHFFVDENDINRFFEVLHEKAAKEFSA